METQEKKQLGRLLLLGWAAAATAYFVSDVWSDYKIKGINAAYEQGRAEVFSGIFEKAQNVCASFEVEYSGQKVELVNAQCLKGNEEQGGQAQ